MSDCYTFRPHSRAESAGYPQGDSMRPELQRRYPRSVLLGLASFALFACSLTSAHAQQVTSPNGAVTVDYGVLNSLGPAQNAGASPWPAYPGGQPQSSAAFPYGQPAYGYPANPAQPLYPPPNYPTSSLLVSPNARTK